MEGRFVAHSPVAPLVKAQTGGIQEDLADVLHQGEADLIDGPGLRQPGEAVLGPQPVHGGLFDDGLTVGHRVELAVEAVALDGELAIPGDQVLQGQGLDALIERLKGPGLEAAQQQHHPLAHAQAQIGPGHVQKVAGKEGPAVLHPDLREAHPPQLLAHQALQPEEAGHGKGKFLHNCSCPAAPGTAALSNFELYSDYRRKPAVWQQE